MMRALVLAWLVAAGVAHAADRYVAFETRPGVRTGYWLMEREGASATLVLIPGGEGGIGLRNGVPTSTNFLVRERDRFAATGFNVAILGKPSDHDDMDLVFRTSEAHMEDLRRVVERLRREEGKPVWLVGTSRGTTSAAAAAIALGGTIDGIVLTSSITDASTPGSVPNMALASIAVPVLTVHHRLDACRLTPPEGARRIDSGLTASPRHQLLLVNGGSGAYGNACQPMHWHGFIGMEGEVVDAIARFVRAQ